MRRKLRGQGVHEGLDRLGGEILQADGAVKVEVSAELVLGALEPAVEDVNGVLARVGEPHRAERVLHNRAEQGDGRAALALGVQGADGLDLVQDVERRPPADHGRMVRSVDLAPQVRSDKGIQPVDPRTVASRCHADMLPQASGRPHFVLGRAWGEALDHPVSCPHQGRPLPLTDDAVRPPTVSPGLR